MFTQAQRYRNKEEKRELNDEIFLIDWKMSTDEISTGSAAQDGRNDLLTRIARSELRMHGKPSHGKEYCVDSQ